MEQSFLSNFPIIAHIDPKFAYSEKMQMQFCTPLPFYIAPTLILTYKQVKTFAICKNSSSSRSIPLPTPPPPAATRGHPVNSGGVHEGKGGQYSGVFMKVLNGEASVFRSDELRIYVRFQTVAITVTELGE